jgi:hypothetical protein
VGSPSAGFLMRSWESGASCEIIVQAACLAP